MSSLRVLVAGDSHEFKDLLRVVVCIRLYRGLLDNVECRISERISLELSEKLEQVETERSTHHHPSQVVRIIVGGNICYIIAKSLRLRRPYPLLSCLSW